jgi:hypothetical protein
MLAMLLKREPKFLVSFVSKVLGEPIGKQLHLTGSRK